MFFAVSMKVSPFDRLLVEAEKSSVSAPNRRAARLKLFRVRVEFSKNRLTQVLPVSSGIFRSPSAIARRNTSALSRMRVISSADRSSRPNRCRRFHEAGIQPSSTIALAIDPSNITTLFGRDEFLFLGHRWRAEDAAADSGSPFP